VTPRGVAFVAVGVGGFVVQIVGLALLTSAGWPLMLATAVAVEAAVLHNFCWHERWTWKDRQHSGRRISRLVRFHAANGLVSIVANVLLTSFLARTFHMPAVPANTLAVGIAAIANFLAADRWVFVRTAPVMLVLAFAAAPAAAAPSRATLDAWDSYVRKAESAESLARPATCAQDDEPEGESISVPGGTIHRWTGCTVVHGTTVNALIDSLVRAGTPPPQEDVLEARLLSRQNDSLHVYLKLNRHAIVTVTYDTEHEMVFHRHSPQSATSRSVATRIAQTDGGDHGFLWRLNSYWTYTQQGTGVRIELVSLSLSRSVPLVIKPVAGPLIAGVARESMVRTLEALRRFLEGSNGRHTAAYGAATTTPAASRAERTRAARRAAPGASPWTQIVSARIGTRDPSRLTTSPRTAICTAWLATASSSSNTAPGTERDTSRPLPS
jgi:putative flippase GtrA